MTQLEFLQAILPALPPSGNFGQTECYFAVSIDAAKNIIQTPCDSFERIIRTCMAASDGGANAYMAIASFRTPLNGRTQQNVLALKSLRCDIDAGKLDKDGKLRPGVYADCDAAKLALVKAIRSGLPAPTILVSSGKGLHVYWCLSEAVPPAVWQPLANALQAAATSRGLLIDSPKTTGTEIVLRLPGTKHISSGSIVSVISSRGPVYAVDDIRDKLGVAAPATTAMPAPPQIPVSFDTSFDAPAALKPTAKNIVANCWQVASMGHGSYHQWYYGMCILKRCADGLEWAHTLSAEDPRYDEASCNKKFNDANADMPVTCLKFSQDNPGGCADCPHRGSVRSPIQLYNVDPDETKHEEETHVILPPEEGEIQRLVIPDHYEYPRVPIVSPHFDVTSDGIIWHKTEKVGNSWETRDIQLCTSQLFYKHGIYSYQDGRPIRSHAFEAVHPNGRVEEVRFNIDTDMTPEGARKWFANANMFPTLSTKQGGAALLDFMNAYLNSVVHTNKAKEIPTFNQFGWTEFADPEEKAIKHLGFVTGTGVITANGMMDARLDEKIERYGRTELTTKGKLERWKVGVNMYKELNQPLGQLAVLMSLVSPLLKYGIGEAQSAIMSIWSSESGKGKSHVLRAAASVWGDPSQQFVSRMASVSLRGFKLGKFQNIPVFFDEMTDVSDNDMYGLAYTLSGGKEKDKMHSSGGNRIETGSWSTTSFITSNRSFKAVIAHKAGDSDATLQRIMEYECDFKNYSNDPEITRYIDLCTTIISQNYGVAGPEFMYQLLKHEDWLATIHPQAVNWITRHGFKNEERFVSSPLAIAIICGRYAVELGILDYDMDYLEHWILSQFIPHNRLNTKDYMPNAKELLAEYITSIAQNTIVVAGEYRLKDEADPEDKTLPDSYIRAFPTKNIVARYNLREQRLVISKTHLSTWLRQNNYSLTSFIRNMDNTNIKLQPTIRRLCANISWCSDAFIKCYNINLEALRQLGVDIQTPTEGVTNGEDQSDD